MAFGKRAGRRIAGSGCACELQEFVFRGFQRAAGEAVSRGACEGRLVAVGVEWLGKNASKGKPKLDTFDRRRVAGCFDSARGDNGRGFIVTGKGSTHGGIVEEDTQGRRIEEIS
jgi:hypothetical protein